VAKPKASNKILLCVSNTGGGHRSAATAIENAINEILRTKSESARENYEVVIVDVVENSHPLHRVFVGIYNVLLRYQQGWMKYYYNMIESLKPDNSDFGYWLASGYLQRLLNEIKPVVVVSIHPMANHYLAKALADANLPNQPALILDVIDPNGQLWNGWACLSASTIIVANELARKRLLSLGIDTAKILIIGMPVDPIFLRPAETSREKFLTDLELSPEKVTICLTAGWAGGGNFIKIYSALKSVSKPIQMLVICGNNEKLFQKIEQISLEMPFKTIVKRELPSLSDAMNACDLLVTKAGGLTTFEAIARHLPMAIDMLTEPMPQESGTAEILIDAGLAQPINDPSDLVSMVEVLEHIEGRESFALPKTNNLDCTHAVYEIAKIILANCRIESKLEIASTAKKQPQ
jgi:processive 1,2-diacylglycerol beta-glucosyltransferase